MPPAGKRGSISVVFDFSVLVLFELAVALPDPVIVPDAEPVFDPLFVAEAPEVAESALDESVLDESVLDESVLGESVLELVPSTLSVKRQLSFHGQIGRLLNTDWYHLA